MKKLISAVLAICMVFGSLSVTAFAAQEADEPEIKDFILVNYSKGDVEQISTIIAENTPSEACRLESGEIYYTAGIPISRYPQLGNFQIIFAVSVKMADKINATLAEKGVDEEIDLMRFIGELALHSLMLIIFNELNPDNWPEYQKYADIFVCADINPDEDRIPYSVMYACGLITAFLNVVFG